MTWIQRHYVPESVRLVGWCLTALSAQKGYIVPCEK